MNNLSQELREKLQKDYTQGKTLNLSLNFACQPTFKYEDYVPELTPSFSKTDSLEEVEEGTGIYKKGSFVYVPFRALSATTIPGRFIDFSTAKKSLKETAGRLLHQSVLKDHEMSVDVSVGKVVESKYSSGSENIPAGVDVLLRLDEELDALLVRRVVTGVVHSASVTVNFDWEPSHPELMESGDFFMKLGEVVNKKQVKILVKEIKQYFEISMVWQGADPYAKQKRSDVPDMSTSQSLSLSNDNKLEVSEMNIKEVLKKVFGKDVTAEGFEEALAEHVDSQKALVEEKLKLSNEKVQSLNAKTLELEKKVSSLETDNASLKSQAEVGATYLEKIREEMISAYKKSRGEDPSEALLTMFKSQTDAKVILEMTASYEENLEKKYPLKCHNCNSTNVSRRSSLAKSSEDQDNNVVMISSSFSQEVNNFHD